MKDVGERLRELRERFSIIGDIIILDFIWGHWNSYL